MKILKPLEELSEAQAIRIAEIILGYGLDHKFKEPIVEYKEDDSLPLMRIYDKAQSRITREVIDIDRLFNICIDGNIFGLCEMIHAYGLFIHWGFLDPTLKGGRIKLQRSKGWNLQETSFQMNGLSAVSVTRSSKWGNPFKVGASVLSVDPKLIAKLPYNILFPKVNRSLSVDLFEVYLLHTPEGNKILEEAKKELVGKNLACYCKLEDQCHSDVYLKLLYNE